MDRKAECNPFHYSENMKPRIGVHVFAKKVEININNLIKPVAAHNVPLIAIFLAEVVPLVSAAADASVALQLSGQVLTTPAGHCMLLQMLGWFLLEILMGIDWLYQVG